MERTKAGETGQRLSHSAWESVSMLVYVNSLRHVGPRDGPRREIRQRLLMAAEEDSHSQGSTLDSENALVSLVVRVNPPQSDRSTGLSC